MNAIVLIALRRPLTGVVLGLLIGFFGAMAVRKTPTDRYRSVILDAFREVEDQLVLTDKLATEAAQQQQALQAAVKVQNIALNLYTGGLDNYLDVTVAQIAALTAQIAEVQVETRRLQTAVALIGTLGGGWTSSDLPTEDQTIPFSPLHLHEDD